MGSADSRMRPKPFQARFRDFMERFRARPSKKIFVAEIKGFPSCFFGFYVLNVGTSEIF